MVTGCWSSVRTIACASYRGGRQKFWIKVKHRSHRAMLA
jgi:hypothetical protein